MDLDAVRGAENDINNALRKLSSFWTSVQLNHETTAIKIWLSHPHLDVEEVISIAFSVIRQGNDSSYEWKNVFKNMFKSYIYDKEDVDKAFEFVMNNICFQNACQNNVDFDDVKQFMEEYKRKGKNPK